MNLPDPFETDWGAQVEIRQDSAGSQVDLTLAAIRKTKVN